MQAGAIAIELFRENPNHPGAAHYIIHSFDHPTYAPLALVAAEKYASIAPAVSHAQHMPTIFLSSMVCGTKCPHGIILHSRWLGTCGKRVILYDQNHSPDWGQYGDLQRGNFERSKLWITRAEQVLAKNSDSRCAVIENHEI